jgi:hypothetical protein
MSAKPDQCDGSATLDSLFFSISLRCLSDYAERHLFFALLFPKPVCTCDPFHETSGSVDISDYVGIATLLFFSRIYIPSSLTPVFSTMSSVVVQDCRLLLFPRLNEAPESAKCQTIRGLLQRLNPEHHGWQKSSDRVAPTVAAAVLSYRNISINSCPRN